MPPIRGGERGRGRVRGRGGRRGSSASAPAATTPDVQPTIEPIVEREVEQPAPIIPPPRAITPSHSSPNDEMDVDPNSSPATQPTETPAPTPIRAPPILPPPSIALASGSTTVPPKKQSKFKPKNVRRTQEELRELQEKERERIDGLNAAAARARKPQFRRTGRGDAMGRGRIVPAAASGPFAEGFDESANKKNISRYGGSLPNMGGGGGISGVQRGGRAGGGGTGGGSGGAGRASASGSRVKSEGITTLNGGNKDAGGESQPEKFIPEPEYPDGDDTPRVDIEQINLLSSDEDEPIVTGSRSRGRVAVDSNKGGQKPIRLQRYEHKNRVAQLNTDPTINLDAENIKDDPDVVVVDEARSTAIVSGATRIKEAQVKDEPGTTASDVLPLSPMLKFKPPLTDIDDDDANMENYEDIENGEVTRVEALPASTLEAKLSRHSKKEKKPVIQTAEDRAEYERHIEDMRVLKDELGNMHTSQQALDGEGNVEIEDAVGDGNKEGRLYLFQFPPVLPKLYNPMTQLKPLHPGQIPIKIKEEPDGDVEMSSSGNKNTIDLTKGKPVNQNGGETILVEEDGKKKDIKRGREKYVDEEGYTGKLIVRESGRVELDWGGTRMLVGRGIPTGFLTTGVLLDPMDPGKDKSEVLGGAFGGRTFQPAVEGKAVGMGEIMGKFVVTPDFGNIM